VHLNLAKQAPAGESEKEMVSSTERFEAVREQQERIAKKISLYLEGLEVVEKSICEETVERGFWQAGLELI